jgi:hypothetical protein
MALTLWLNGLHDDDDDDDHGMSISNSANQWMRTAAAAAEPSSLPMLPTHAHCMPCCLGAAITFTHAACLPSG